MLLVGWVGGGDGDGGGVEESKTKSENAVYIFFLYKERVIFISMHVFTKAPKGQGDFQKSHK